VIKFNFYKKSFYKIVENSLSLFSFKLIDLGLTLWLIPFLILKVGVQNYGMYAFAMAFVLFFVNVLNYGFNLSAVRELAKNKNNHQKTQKIFNEVLSVKLVLFIGLYILYLFLVYTIPKFTEYMTLYLASSLVLFGDFFSLRWFFMGLEKMKYIAVIHLGGTLIFVFFVFQFIDEPSNYVKIPLYEAAGMLIASIVSFVWVVRMNKFKLKLNSLSEVWCYLKNNFSSFINLLLPSTYGISVVFFVGVFGVPQHTSFMQIGVKFAAAFTTINNILTNVFYPIVNRKQKTMLSVRIILMSTGFILSLAMFFLAQDLISIWLNLEDKVDLGKTIVIVKILSPIPILMGIISSYGINGLLTFYEDVLYGKITIVSSLVMLMSAIYLIPRFSVSGAAIAFLLGRVVNAFCVFVFYKKKVNKYV